MKGFVFVETARIAADESLAGWVERGAAVARSLRVGHAGQEIPSVFQFFEVLVEKCVVPVVAGRPFHTALE